MTNGKITGAIDWSIHDKYPEDTVTCKSCGTKYRSHSKFIFRGSSKAISSGAITARKPCPNCKGTELSKASSDLEEQTIK